MARLQDRAALITGGESGIGLATARLFVSEGARVHLVGIDDSKLAAAVDELDVDNALSSVADVTDEDAVRRAIGEGVDRYGRLDILFSNAGISGAVAPIAEYPADVFARRSRSTCSGPSTSSNMARRTSPTVAASSSRRASPA